MAHAWRGPNGERVLIVSPETLARALSLAEVGCWASRRPTPAEDGKAHRRDAVTLLAALDNAEAQG